MPTRRPGKLVRVDMELKDETGILSSIHRTYSVGYPLVKTDGES